MVFNDSGKWFVRLAGKEAGPSTKVRAVKAAIETAEEATRQGRTARVRVQTGAAGFETVWPIAAKGAARRSRSKR